ncbi:MAG TPA: cell division protein FtsA, partial [Flavisolibacter sp.]|nr:cell division protein FtsA [Flavisolibacter sp.]
TCLGLILKGYDDYEHNRKQFEQSFKPVSVPDVLRTEAEEAAFETEGDGSVGIAERKGLKDFWGRFKHSLIEIFKEEEDSKF